ncbi:hypothetical protein M8C21_005754 [Ambrosia artemisiifolia]|uniref:Uncharacterized protein n=1 Tax=Ambrosia artemisiifolia TaxID=4212 RepID=A0AAD5BM50_AMBAR|nr:hypothetical protein M8C21_005754 [Ambrosia artemisiifolia]
MIEMSLPAHQAHCRILLKDLARSIEEMLRELAVLPASLHTSSMLLDDHWFIHLGGQSLGINLLCVATLQARDETFNYFKEDPSLFDKLIYIVPHKLHTLLQAIFV